MSRQKKIKADFDININGFEYLGRGATALGIFASGWSSNEKILYRCANCGSTMIASHNDYWNCSCSAIHLDYHTGRFGSKYGNKNILVYKKVKNIGNQKNYGLIFYLKSFLRRIFKPY
ncbi:MAG: hypothetical protein R2785_12815 [Flavobacteriaceae bacterium]